MKAHRPALSFGGVAKIGFDAVENPVQCAFKAVIVGELSTDLDEPGYIRELAGRQIGARKLGLVSRRSFDRNEAIHKYE